MATLPAIPKGKELEDYVAALLQCAGYFVEKSIIERGPAEVLEIDMVATRYTGGLPKRLLFEVKSGDWGFSDIFKLLGWKTYLSPDRVDDAYFVATEVSADKPIKFFQEKCEQLGIFLLAVGGHTQIEKALTDLGIISNAPTDTNHALWRYSLWLERKMLKVVADSRRSHQDKKGPSDVYDYQELIKNGVILTGDVRERSAALYEAHFGHQWLAKAVAADLHGVGYDPDSPPDDTPVWTKALYECEYPLIQAAFYYEHKARLSILKGAVDYACLEKAGALPKGTVIKFLGLEIPMDLLPPNFHQAVKGIREIECFEKIPALWQTFLWKWGGFFLMDKEEEERIALASEVDMPVTAANRALELFDKLFPTDGGWYLDLQGTKIIKLFPCPFRGIGAALRLSQVGSEGYQAFYAPGHQYRPRNLIRWHNSAAALLGP